MIPDLVIESDSLGQKELKHNKPKESQKPLVQLNVPEKRSKALEAPVDEQQIWAQLKKLQQFYNVNGITAKEYNKRKSELVDQMTGTKFRKSTKTKSSRSRTHRKPHTLHQAPRSSLTHYSVDNAARSFRKKSHLSRTQVGSQRSHKRSVHTQEKRTYESLTHHAGLRSNSVSVLVVPHPPPDFESFPSERALLNVFHLPEKRWSYHGVDVKIDHLPFAKGSLRTAHHMQGLQSFIKNKNTQYVVKFPIKPTQERDSYFREVIMQTECQEYAQAYNKCKPPKKVNFINAWLLELENRPGRPLCHAERFIVGKYRKHNNNFGYVSDEERNTPQAFSHFTYEESKHRILICDIQGVDDCYTDPQIHSLDGKGYGDGNMGEKGIQTFLATHRCNPICQYLNLPLMEFQDNNKTVPAAKYMTKLQSNLQLKTSGSYQDSAIMPLLEPDDDQQSFSCKCTIF